MTLILRVYRKMKEVVMVEVVNCIILSNKTGI